MTSGRFWFRLHGWAGLCFYLLLTVILVSGTLAVFAAEIDWLLYPAKRVAPGAERCGAGALVDAVRRAKPQAAILEGYVDLAADRPRTAASAMVVSQRQGVSTVWIDPYRCEARGETSLLTAGRLLASLHASLFVPAVGYAIVSLFSLLLCASLVTGLFTYKGWTRGFRRRPRTSRGRLLAGDLHRLLGVWTLPFSIAVVVTGFVYLWDFAGVPYASAPARPVHAEPLELDGERLAALGPDEPARLPIDVLVERAVDAVPGLVATGLVLPQHAAGVFTVLGTRGEWFVDPRATRVDLDPYSGTVLRRRLVGGLADRLHQAVNPVHFGFFGGVASKALWLLFGVGLSALAVSGVVTHVLRLRGQPAARWWRPWGGPMGWAKPINLLVLLLGAVGLAGFATLVGEPQRRVGALLEPQPVGPWTAGLAFIDELAVLGRGAPLAPGATALVVVDLRDGRFAQARRAVVEVGSGDAGALAHAELDGEDAFLHGHLRLPESLPAAAELRLVVEDWSGARHTARWPVAQATPPGSNSLGS